jgi:hypothetical protein
VTAGPAPPSELDVDVRPGLSGGSAVMVVGLAVVFPFILIAVAFSLPVSNITSPEFTDLSKIVGLAAEVPETVMPPLKKKNDPDGLELSVTPTGVVPTEPGVGAAPIEIETLPPVPVVSILEPLPITIEPLVRLLDCIVTVPLNASINAPATKVFPEPLVAKV